MTYSCSCIQVAYQKTLKMSEDYLFTLESRLLHAAWSWKKIANTAENKKKTTTKTTRNCWSI